MLSVSFANVPIQFGSHIFPPSAENDCSSRNETGVTSEKDESKIARTLKEFLIEELSGAVTELAVTLDGLAAG